MTISTGYSPIVVLGNGVTTAFVVTWPFASPADLVVGLLDTTTNTYLANVTLNGGGTYGYTVTGMADANTGIYPNGTVLFNAPPAATHKVVIQRVTANVQSVVLQNNGPLPAKTLERALDALTLQAAEAGALARQAVALPVSAVGVSNVMPIPVSSQILGWSADGLSLVSYSPAALGVLTTYSTAVVQTFSGTGAQTVFTLSAAPGTQSNTLVHVGGVYQPKSSYALSGTSLTFNTAPASGTNNIEVMWVAPTTIAVGTPSDGSVTPAKLSTGGPSWDGSGNLTAVGNVTAGNNAVAKAFVPNAATVPTNGLYLPGTNIIGWATNTTERLRLGASGELGIAGANYGAAGQVLTSGGTGAAFGWASPAASPVGAIISAPAWSAATGSASGTGSVATIGFTGAATTLPVGSTVVIAGMTPSGYNGTWVVTASGPNSVSFACTATGAQSVAGTIALVPAGGFLKCDGGIYTRTSYAALAAFIGAPILPAAEASPYTNASLLAGGIYQANAVLFMNGTAVNSGSTAAANATYTSPDGTAWTARTAWNLGTQLNLNADVVAYNGSTYCALTATTLTPMVMTTTDLSAWTRVTALGSAGQPAEIAYGGTGNVFILLGGSWACGWSDTKAASSPTGATWTAITLTGVTGTPVAVAAYASGVVLLSTTKAFYSATGTGTYTDITSSITTPGTFRGLSYQNGKFILVCDNGIWTSTTGAAASWTQVAQQAAWPLDVTFGKIRWNGAAYVASRDGQTYNYYSLDLTAWGRTNPGPKGAPTTTMQVSGVQASKFWGRAAGGVVRNFDFASYTAGTQFPVPALGDAAANLSVGAASSFVNSPVGQQTYFIKT